MKMKLSFLLITSTLLIGCSTVPNKNFTRAPASVGTENVITRIQENKFVINENGMKLSLTIAKLMENSSESSKREVAVFTKDGSLEFAAEFISVEGTFSSSFRDGDDAITHKRMGGKISLRKDWSNTSEFYKWRKSVMDGKVERKSISVIFQNDAGEETSITFHECFPTKWDGPAMNAKNSGHAVEKIEISFERMEIK